VGLQFSVIEADFLNRDEAVSLLKELIFACDGIGEEGVMLMPPNSGDVLSHGYQLHIKESLWNEYSDCIEPLVKKHELALAHEHEKQLLVVYKPMEKRG